ncbi:MAG: hypothetical protein QOJ30_2631, partial [Pseudonocardiales bacterium]|nr:hypothetical protein [Pseudonocardiales bacterium]
MNTTEIHTSEPRKVAVASLVG